MPASLWCFAACWIILFVVRLFLCACYCFSNFLILLGASIAWLLLSVTGIMLARNVLKRKELSLFDKTFDIIGLVLNSVVIGFVLISSVSLLDYWREVKRSEALSEELRNQALEEWRDYEERKSKEQSTTP